MNQDGIFRAYDIRGRVPDELTPETALHVGQALAKFLPKAGSVVVGRDMRPDSEALASKLITGLTQSGRDVMDIGLVTSDMVYFAVGKYNLAGGAMITASHNPGQENGIKLYRDGVQPIGFGSGLEEIRDMAKVHDLDVPTTAGKLEPKDITDDWITHVLSFVEISKIKPFKVAIDTANGMAGKILPKIQSQLPIVITPLYWELDGSFPNHEPNPMKPENLQDLAQVVKNQQLDFGIAFDGDGDRMIVVDETGLPVPGSVIISLLAKFYLRQHPGSAIVHEVRTSRSTIELIKKLGGKPIRAKAGRTNIGPAMRRAQAIFGGETSGHLYFKDNFYADSGLIGALVTMAALSESDKKVSEQVAELNPYFSAGEINFEIQNKEAVIKIVAQKFKDGRQDWLDGLTVNYPDWWFNLRPSNTEPILRLNIEAIHEEVLSNQLERVKQLIKS